MSWGLRRVEVAQAQFSPTLRAAEQMAHGRRAKVDGRDGIPGGPADVRDVEQFWMGLNRPSGVKGIELFEIVRARRRPYGPHEAVRQGHPSAAMAHIELLIDCFWILMRPALRTHSRAAAPRIAASAVLRINALSISTSWRQSSR